MKNEKLRVKIANIEEKTTTWTTARKARVKSCLRQNEE